MNFGLSYWVSAVLGALPLLIAYLIGIGAALVQMRTFPRVALLVGIAFAALLLISVVQMGVQPLVISLVIRNERISPEARQIVSAVIASLFNLGRAVFTGLLCYAAFAGRSAASSSGGR